MASTAEILKRLSALDIPANALREVMSIIADVQAGDEDRKRKDRERKRAKSSTPNGEASDAVSVEIPRKEAGNSAEIPPETCPKPQPLACAFSIGEEVDRYTPENATHSSPKGEKIKSETPVSHLSPIVGPDLAAELVDHRKRMRRPMTAGSARRLAAKLSEVDDPSAAARLMIDRGWQGFEPEWVTNPKAIGARAGPLNGHAPPRPAPLSPRMQALSDIANEQPNHHDEQTDAPASDPDASGGAIRAIGWARRAG